MTGKITIVVGEIGDEQTFFKLAKLAKTELVLIEPEIHQNLVKLVAIAKNICKLCKEQNINIVVSTNSDILCSGILRRSVTVGLLKTITVYEIVRKHNKLVWLKKNREKGIYSEGECDIDIFQKAITATTIIGGMD